MGFLSGLKQTYNIAKQLAPAVFSGVKAGLVLGRGVIDVSRNVSKELSNVPRLGQFFETFVQSQQFKDTEELLKKGQAVTNAVDFVLNKGKPKPDPTAKALFKDRPKLSKEDILAQQIAEGMA